MDFRAVIVLAIVLVAHWFGFGLIGRHLDRRQRDRVRPVTG